MALEVQQTKRTRRVVQLSPQSNERAVRQQLAGKVSGSHMGLWLLIPEFLRLGAWEVIKEVFGSHRNPLAAHLGLHLANEAAVCVGRLRRKDSLCHQGFSLASGLSVLPTDQSIHQLLGDYSMADYESLQQSLLKRRRASGHYTTSPSMLVLDPHRIGACTARIMPQKKKTPAKPARKMMQTFFCNDLYTGQPLAMSLAASGKTCSQATAQMLAIVERAGFTEGLLVADKEHFTRQITEYFATHPGLDVLMPAPNTKAIRRQLAGLDYQRQWPGYGLAETCFAWKDAPTRFRLIGQREGERPAEYCYKGFLTTSPLDASPLVTLIYSQRWSIEEFFNAEADMGWNRAGTFNLHIRYGKASLALLAQAATYNLRQRLPGGYRDWSARSLAQKALTNMEGDLRVSGDTITVTFYRDHLPLQLTRTYSNISDQLQREGICPKIPWLMDYKLDFQFK